MFMDVNDANEVLSDPDKRATYDLDGEEGLKKEKEQGNRPQGGLWDVSATPHSCANNAACIRTVQLTHIPSALCCGCIACSRSDS